MDHAAGSRVVPETGSKLDVECPSCLGRELIVIDRRLDIPVHSCILLDSAEQAVAYARGDLVLGFCGACGFATNVVYDESLVDYSCAYEETQGFSETFNAFARELASDWIERYNLRARDIVEIGCGKGEFLSLMASMGGNRCVGYDPAVDSARVLQPEAGKLSLVQQRFNRQSGTLEADFLCCRHTLEHIGPTLEFMRDVRAAIPDGRNTILGFELPDFERVLNECAFWDVYYEHCSYFSTGSLARLFERAGFEILDLRRVYEGQYLIIEARPGPPGVDVRKVGADDLDELRALTRYFARTVSTTIADWRARLDGWRSAKKTVVLWGSGSKAVGFLTAVKADVSISHVVDINPYKNDRYMPGCPQRIIAPEKLREVRPDVVIVMNPIYRDEIGAALRNLELNPEMVMLK